MVLKSKILIKYMNQLLILLIIIALLALFQNRKEGYGGMMRARSRRGANISVPADCSKRGVDYCTTTKGCIWVNGKCGLKKGWIHGSVGHGPLYVPRVCHERKEYECGATDGCEWASGPRVENGCNVRKGYRAVKTAHGEIIYIKKTCGGRTISECGSGKNCIWLQGKCMKRDANQRHKGLHSRKKACAHKHNGVGFGKDVFSCSDKPVPLAPSRMKSGIREDPPQAKKDIPTISQTKACPYRCENKEYASILSILSGKKKPKDEDPPDKLGAKYVKQLEMEIQQLGGSPFCDEFCGKKKPHCVEKMNVARGTCGLKKFDSREACENAWAGLACRWETEAKRPCTPACNSHNCPNCRRESEDSLKGGNALFGEENLPDKAKKIKKCLKKWRRRKLPPFYRPRKKVIYKPGPPPLNAGRRASVTTRPRVEEVNISMNLNKDLVPYNAGKYTTKLPVKVKRNPRSRVPGQDWHNCVYNNPSINFFNKTFLGVTRCGLMGSNALLCKKLGDCTWFAGESDFAESNLGKKTIADVNKFEKRTTYARNQMTDSAIKYMFMEDPITSKEWIKLGAGGRGDKATTTLMNKLVDFLQTKEGKRWAKEREYISFERWILDWGAKFSGKRRHKGS